MSLANCLRILFGCLTLVLHFDVQEFQLLSGFLTELRHVLKVSLLPLAFTSAFLHLPKEPWGRDNSLHPDTNTAAVALGATLLLCLLKPAAVLVQDDKPMVFSNWSQACLYTRTLHGVL